MNWSSWLLCLIVAALTVHYPWLIELPLAVTVAAAQQPAVLAVAAVLLAGHKLHQRRRV